MKAAFEFQRTCAQRARTPSGADQSRVNADARKRLLEKLRYNESTLVDTALGGHGICKAISGNLAGATPATLDTATLQTYNAIDVGAAAMAKFSVRRSLSFQKGVFDYFVFFVHR